MKQAQEAHYQKAINRELEKQKVASDDGDYQSFERAEKEIKNYNAAILELNRVL